MGWEVLWILAAVAAVLCAVGFYRFVYFLSVGYGFAVAGIGVALAVLFGSEMQAVNYLQCALLLIYGARLSSFLILREAKNARYRKTLAEATTAEKTMPIYVKAFIWIFVSVLYVAQTCPIFYQLYNRAGGTVLPWIGVALSACAIVLESVADHQKSAQKAVRPDMVATKGLYRIVRCPNYLAEILFWTGVLVGGLAALQNIGQWIAAAFGYICIVLIMFNGAKRLETRQMARYKQNEEYRNYADHTPILLPFVPLYHLVKEEPSEK